MDRCNLTITRLPAYADLPEFLAEHGVEVVASLPSFAARQTDAQIFITRDDMMRGEDHAIR